MRNGRVRGVTPPVWVQMIAAPNSAATSTSAGVGAAPGVVEHVGALRADRAADLRAPGVDADDEIGVRRPHPGDEVDDPAALLVGVDLDARAPP